MQSNFRAGFFPKCSGILAARFVTSGTSCRNNRYLMGARRWLFRRAFTIVGPISNGFFFAQQLSVASEWKKQTGRGWIKKTHGARSANRQTRDHWPHYRVCVWHSFEANETFSSRNLYGNFGILCWFCRHFDHLMCSDFPGTTSGFCYIYVFSDWSALAVLYKLIITRSSFVSHRVCFYLS